MFKVNNYSRYFCDSFGNIFSENYKNSGKVKQLKPAVSTDGYLKTVLLRDDGKYVTVAVHRWCAEAYFGTKAAGDEVNHKNGIKTDNRIENLEYCSRSKNIQHAFDTGLAKGLKGSNNSQSKLTEEDVIAIREVAKTGRYYGRKELAKKYGVSESCIKDIVTRRRSSWSHV